MSTISITHKLGASDKDCVDVPVSEVEAYLTKHTDAYERTLPTERNQSINNRAYIDLDGYAGKMSEPDFDELCENIKGGITFGIPFPIAMMEASQYGYKKDTRINKLSFRIQFIKTHGSKNAIKQFVLSTIHPLLAEILQEHIPVHLNVQDKNIQKYLSIDMGVYNLNGRKMRLWNSSKDNENRPNKLVGDAMLEDTLITYIPSDSIPLPEPEEEIKIPKKEKALSTTTDPKNEEVAACADAELLVKVLMGLNEKRYSNYHEFIKVGFICFNEGLPLKVWEDWAKQSTKNKKGDCAKHWAGFTKGNLAQGTLWMWLKEDNIALFKELFVRREDFWTLLGNPNHAETAKFFFNAKPDAYTYNENLGWFQLQISGIWKQYPKIPSGLMSDIWTTLKKINKEHWETLDPDPANKEDAKKVIMCRMFASQIGKKSFVDGVVAFLPSNYNDDKLDKKMDESRHLFAFADKVIDLDKREVRDIKPNDYVCINTGYNYPIKSNPDIRKEINEILMSIWENQTIVSYVLQILAVCLHGRKNMEEFYVWAGRGGNGKGILAEIIKAVFGDYYHSIPNDCLTKRSDKKDTPSPAIANGKGKRFVQAQEPEGEEKLQVGTIKELTGGDEITARALYCNPVKFVPQWGLFLQCNTIPKLSAMDGGIKRRMVVINFPFQFVECMTEAHHRPINIGLKDRICKSQEIRDEFILMLYEIFGKRIVKPTAVLDATNEYMAENDAVSGWLKDNYNVDMPAERKYKISQKELYDEFLFESGTTRDQMSASQFKKLMEMNKVQQKRESNNFDSQVWNDMTDSYEKTVMKAGSYFMYLERKR